MLAKGIFFINEDDLKDVLGIPKEVEIIGFSKDIFGGVEMELRSAKEIDGVTVYGNTAMIRRVGYKKKNNYDYELKIDISVGNENSKEVAEKVSSILKKNWTKVSNEKGTDVFHIEEDGSTKVTMEGFSIDNMLDTSEFNPPLIRERIDIKPYKASQDNESIDSFDSILDTAKNKHGERK